MDDTSRDLLAACAAAPEDSAPRLILADWLEEHGHDERATALRRHVTEWGRYRQGSIKLRVGQVRALLGPAAVQLLELENNAPEQKRHRMGRKLRFSGRDPVMVRGAAMDFWLPQSAPKTRFWLSFGLMIKARTNLTNWLTHAPRLVREQPPFALNLGNYAPLREEGTAWRYWWFNGPDFERPAQRRAVLHGHLWDHLDKEDGSLLTRLSESGQLERGYTTYEEAMQALQRAAFAYAWSVSPSY